LPAVLAAEVKARSLPREADIITVEADAVEQFAGEAIKSLTIASEASVPLDSGTSARFVIFRDSIGGTSTAIIVGKPDFTNAVPVRLHSACLTGDVFGSRRCDCGDQLQLAMTRLDDLGGGVVLYLAQEGRGVGLANKMRTYQLQLVGPHFVGETNSTPFLRQIKHHAATKIVEPGHRKLKLIPTVAAPRTEDVAREACRVQPDRHSIGEIGLADDNRGGCSTDRVTKNDEACRRSGIQGHRGFTRYCKRSDRFFCKLLYSIGFDCDDVCFAGKGMCRHFRSKYRR